MRIGLLIAVLCLLQTPLMAADIVLQWDDVNPPGIVQAFHLYRYSGPTNRTRLATTTNANARQLTHTNCNVGISNIYTVAASYAVSMSNQTAEAESPKLILQPISAPFNLANRYASRRWIIPALAWLQRSRDLATWENHIHNDGSNSITITVRERPEFPQEFYRVNTNIVQPPPLP